MDSFIIMPLAASAVTPLVNIERKAIMEISVTKHFLKNNMTFMDLDLIIDLIQQECYSEVIEKIRLLP